MHNEKGGLIKKNKQPTIMQPAAPVKSTESVQAPTPVIEKQEVVITPEQPRKNLGVGQTNSTKSLNVTTIIYGRE